MREMIGYLAQRQMEADVETLVGAAHGERSESRESCRKDYRERDWQTRSGIVALKIPKLRKATATSQVYSSLLPSGLPLATPRCVH